MPTNEVKEYTAEFTKQPFEQQTRSMDWSRNVSPPTTTLADGHEVHVYELDEAGDHSTETTSTMIHGTPSINGTHQIYTIKNGQDGKDYDISLRVVLSNGDKLEDDILMHVRET